MSTGETGSAMLHISCVTHHIARKRWYRFYWNLPHARYNIAQTIWKHGVNGEGRKAVAWTEGWASCGAIRDTASRYHAMCGQRNVFFSMPGNLCCRKLTCVTCTCWNTLFLCARAVVRSQVLRQQCIDINRPGSLFGDDIANSTVSVVAYPP